MQSVDGDVKAGALLPEGRWRSLEYDQRLSRRTWTWSLGPWPGNDVGFLSLLVELLFWPL